MIKFPNSNPDLKTLATYYSGKLNKPLLTDFLLNDLPLAGEPQALLVCRQFQQLIDIAMLDNDKPDSIKSILNIENQLFSLFNLVYHALLSLGFEQQWQQAADEVIEQQKE